MGLTIPRFLFLPTCLSVYQSCTYSDCGSQKTGVIDGCKLPCGCWERNLGPLEEQLVLLTPESSPYPMLGSEHGTQIPDTGSQECTKVQATEHQLREKPSLSF